MNQLSYHIRPLDPLHHVAALELEKGIIQGRSVQLEILKESFLSRALPFDAYFAAIAMAEGGELIGSAIGAGTRIMINGKEFNAGFAFDTKVNPDWRGHQVGRNLAKTLYKDFFQPHSLAMTFMTAKATNLPVLKMAANTVSRTWTYPFVYLTIPTSARINKKLVNTGNQAFNVTAFNKANLSPDYLTELENGLGYFKTYRTYQLKVRKLSWFIKSSISILKSFRPGKYRSLPNENQSFSFATLYNHNSTNLAALNCLLEKLEKEGINYLMVCCAKHDSIYNSLKNKSINTYPYCLVSDFELNPTDKITIDVRCL